MSNKLKPVSFKQLQKVFEADGFRLIRERGDHMVFEKRGVIRPIVIPKYDHVPVFIVMNSLRAAGMSRERYFELLRDE